MKQTELLERSVYIVTEYYKNNLQPFFENMREDVLWLGPAEGQELRGRETVRSAFAAEQHELTFTMGPVRSVCIPLSDTAQEVLLQYEIYTHYPDGRTDFYNQRLQYSWCRVQSAEQAEPDWLVAMFHVSNALRYNSQDAIYPSHYETVEQDAFDRCDYFAYLDAKNDRFSMIHGQLGAPLLPERSEHYEQDMADYIRQFVVETDQERVLRETRLSRVLEQIGRHGSHSVTYGVQDAARGYTRKRLDYRYHEPDELRILMSRTDITDLYFEEEKKRQELDRALVRAQTDPLTGLLNVRTLADKLRERLANESGSFALYFIDLDNFKSINDHYGHPAGDTVLRQIADALRAVQQKGSLLGRIGGDEFVCFAPVSDKDHAAALAQRICAAIQSVRVEGRAERPVTGSVGVALAPQDGRDYETLVQKADHGLYAAKKGGKNQYIF